MGKQTILCVDDEQDYLEDIVEFLASESYDVVTATSGADGVQQFMLNRPDLVLCDIRMPEMSGLEMLEVLQKKQRDEVCKTPFIYLTAWGDKEYQMSANALGSDDFLTKPVDFDLLLSTIQAKLDRWQNHEQVLQHDAKQYQLAMMNMLETQIRKPLEGGSTFAELMDASSPTEIKRYKANIDCLVTQGLKHVTSMSDLILLTLEDYPIEEQEVEATTLLWEAAVYGLGYGKTMHMQIVDPHHSVVCVDQVLCQKAMGNIIEAASLHAVGGMPWLNCKTNIEDDQLEFVISSSQKRYKQAKHWIEIRDSAQLLNYERLMHRQGVQQLYMFEVAKRQKMSYWLDMSSPEDPVNKLQIRL